MFHVKSAENKKPTHTYTILYFNTPDGVLILNGRESAVYKQALKDLKSQLKRLPKRDIENLYTLIQNHGSLLNEVGANPKFGIGRNLSGVLLIGRTALVGGAVDRSDSSTVTAALRELKEEVYISNVPAAIMEEFWLRPVDGKRREQYYLLDLARLVSDPEYYAQRCIKEFYKKSQTDTAEKVALDVVPLTEYAALLAAPDEEDITYIKTEMARVAKELCDHLFRIVGKSISEEAREKLAQDLTHYQVNRPLPGAVEAVQRFMQRVAPKLATTPEEEVLAATVVSINPNSDTATSDTATSNAITTATSSSTSTSTSLSSSALQPQRMASM